ncbi:50S ribosomal protein L24 [Candidatus Micrarchaeota archaeon]|nr:50S ribosomal protein L24 [Candidatus Micrarchaeota archaeon]
MIKSSKPRKQRKFIREAPFHIRKKFLNAHISKPLKTQLGTKKRTIAIKKGDKVQIKVGNKKGKSGKILKVNYKRSMIYIEGITRLNSKSEEKFIAVRPSNIEIIELVMDKDRTKIFKR